MTSVIVLVLNRLHRLTAIVIHRVGNGACALEDLSTGESLLVETLMVAAAGRGWSDD